MLLPWLVRPLGVAVLVPMLVEVRLLAAPLLLLLLVVVVVV